VKILVIAMAGIGDTLIATPLIHELRANFPEATIDALARWPGAKDLLAGNPYLNRAHQCNFSDAGAPAFLKFLAGLRKERYDVSINAHPQSKIEYRIVARIVGATQRLSHTYDNSSFLDRFLVTQQLPQDYGIHSADNNLKLLPLLGKTPKLASHEFELFLSSEEMAAAEAIVRQNGLAGRRVVGIHAGSGRTKNLRMKRWPVENYIALIRKLTSARPDVTVLLFGGP